MIHLMCALIRDLKEYRCDVQMAQQVSDHLNRQLVQGEAELTAARQALADTQKAHESAVKASAADSAHYGSTTCSLHVQCCRKLQALNILLGLLNIMCFAHCKREQRLCCLARWHIAKLWTAAMSACNHNEPLPALPVATSLIPCLPLMSLLLAETTSQSIEPSQS